jgi:hypothetical protein
MPDRSADPSPRTAALIAGFGYLGILVANTVALSGVDGLIVKGDAATTAGNIVASESLFRLGIASWIVVLALDVVVAWALWVFLEPAGRQLAMLAAWFRLLFVAVAGSALVSLFAVPSLLAGGGATALVLGQSNALTTVLLDPYEHGFNIGFVFFGMHLLCLGILILASGQAPRLLGILLLVASGGDFIDSFASIVLPWYANDPALFVVFVAVPALVAEYSLTFWLLARGGKSERRERPLSVGA